MLKHDQYVRKEFTWEDFKEKGLCPNIKNLEDYKLQFEENSRQAKDFLETIPAPILQIETLQTLHRILYKNIYPWAGNLREKPIFCRGREGAPHIKEELLLLEKSVKNLLETANSTMARLRIAAFQHARLTTIQAFNDGNSRLSRLVTKHFLSSLLEKEPTCEIERTTYLESLEHALSENLAPLTNQFRKAFGLGADPAQYIPSPYKPTNHYSETPKLSKRCALQNINSETNPAKIKILKNYPWDKISATLTGKPNPNTFAECKALWEFHRDQELDQKDFTELLNLVLKKKPTKSKWFQSCKLQKELNQIKNRVLNEFPTLKIRPQSPEIQPRM
jgi:fido (protein-threonine AMPylation protein)